MLQTVPDPFDSYGPPQSEDQIFSILPPLSIMTGPTTSSAPTPIMTTPEMGIEGLPVTSSSRTNSWSAPSNGFFPSESTEWADIPSPTSTPTPPRSTSPPAMIQSRRHSAPPLSSPGHHSRRSESSKLRSVLTVIDESHSRQSSSHEPEPEPPEAYSSTINGSGSSSIAEPQPEKKSVFAWSSPFSYGQSPYASDTDDNITPRNSSFSNLPPPSTSPLDTDSQRFPPEETVHNGVTISVTT